jgi:hypothetical protein
VEWRGNICMEWSTWPSQLTRMELENPHATKCSSF